MVAVAVTAVLAVSLAAAGWGVTRLRSITSAVATADVIAPGAADGDGGQNVLLVGLDARTDAQGDPLPQPVLDALHAGSASDGGDTTDTMIVVHIPEGPGPAVAISVPRDSYVEVPGYGKHKINAAYSLGRADADAALRARGVTGPALAEQSAAGGARTAIAAVQLLTGLTITHYAALDLAGFVAITRAVGGVPVCLNAAVDDPYSGADLPAGRQILDGQQALGDRVVAHCLSVELESPDGHDDTMQGPEQRIWGFETNFGGLAELALVKSNQLMPKPGHLSWEEAASTGLVNSTAYRLLVSHNGADMKQGDTVLVWGASGGVGSHATQMVLNGGGIPVCVVSSPEKAELCRRMGAELIIDRAAEGYRFWVDEHTQDPTEWKRLGGRIRELTGGHDPDIVVEHPGRETFGASVYVARKGGTMRFRFISNAHQGKVGVLCLAPTEGMGVSAPELRDKHVVEINRFRKPAPSDQALTG